MKRLHCLLCAVCLLIGILSVPLVAQVRQPEVNLGLTSFLDGGPPAGPGWYFAGYLQYYTSDKFANAPIPGFDANVWANLNQFIYQSSQAILLGGKWGIDIIVPLVCLDSGTPFLPDNGAGLGDIVVGPFLQWDPIMGRSGPRFMHRVELQTIWPTGRYDNDEAMNPGSNFFSFNPYWAGTYFFTPRWTASWRAHYLWNDKNDSPFSPFGLDDAQAGDAFHINFAAAYEVLPKQLRVGINGYYFQQFSATKANGQSVPGKEKVCAIGPGLMWSFSQDSHLFFNVYFETDADYRPEGQRFVLRYVHHF